MFCIMGEPFLWKWDSSVNTWINYQGVYSERNH